MPSRNETGKTDRGRELRRKLPCAAPDYLAGAVENPALGPQELVLLLRNRQAPASALRQIAARPEWTSRREIRELLALHPSSPLPLARRYLAHLAWTDLAEAARDVRVSPSIRRDAERILIVRLPEMAVGERVALARRATRRILAALRADSEAAVLLALLDNPRAAETDATTLAASSSTPATVLDRLARDPRWNVRPSVRRRLVRNRATPVPASLKLVARASRGELLRLSRDEGAPGFVRISAERRLGSSRGPGEVG